MKNALILQAKYNKISNQKMFELLIQQTPQILNKDYGLYYKSIIGTLLHILRGEIEIFIKEFSKYAQQTPHNLETLIISIPREDAAEIHTLAKLCAQADEAILQIIENTCDFQKEETLSFANNISFHKSRLQLMLSILNHSTHHRGEISAILDTLKIPNDFNGMLGI